MSKYIDPHTLITIVIILAGVALTIAKVDLPPWLLALAASVSPGLVFKKPEADPPKPEPKA